MKRDFMLQSTKYAKKFFLAYTKIANYISAYN